MQDIEEKEDVKMHPPFLFQVFRQTGQQKPVIQIPIIGILIRFESALPFWHKRIEPY